MENNKKNLFLKNTTETFPYKYPRNNPTNPKIPERDPYTHIAFIESMLAEVYKQNEEVKKSASYKTKDGIYIEFSGLPGYYMNTRSLENLNSGIRLLNVKKSKINQDDDKEDEIVKATIFVPSGKEGVFLKKIEKYKTEYKNRELIDCIENIKLAILESFWIGKKDYMPDQDVVWCEIWLRYNLDKRHKETPDDIEKKYLEACELIGIKTDTTRIIFPERIVKLANANRKQLTDLINVCPYIAEIRRAQEATSFFNELINSEQGEWCEDLLNRTELGNENLSVCLLDTGITGNHPLLKNFLLDNGTHSVKANWDTGDRQGHGTEMAGIIVYNDLKELLSNNEKIFIPHKIESVKILQPHYENQPDLYGDTVQNAVLIPEIFNPNVNRVYCMAVTSSCYNTQDGSPSSWSAALDSITSGSEEDNVKRLFFISAGNVPPGEVKRVSYPASSVQHGVESPGQSWNSITVGGYAEENPISESGFDGFFPVAHSGELSPFSSTSLIWDKKWPIKPEILLYGGNMASNGFDISECTDLSLLTTNYRPFIKHFSTIWGTSSATAQASWMAAQLMADYPEAWPETIRALLIHSADWTESMKRQFCEDDTKPGGRRNLLRSCGYGIPDLQKARECLNNQVNLVIEESLQPFEKNKMKEMHFHKLPWPKEELLQLGDKEATVKITLSYFIEPGPGEIGWNNKYRYPSCGLRFDVINTDENITDFQKRINKKMREEDSDKGEGSSGSARWFLGSNNRDVGSIHSDSFTATAANLCDINYIAIYPVIGWWRERSYLGKGNNSLRYSLVVSISTRENEVDFYNEIINEISPEILISVSE